MNDEERLEYIKNNPFMQQAHYEWLIEQAERAQQLEKGKQRLKEYAQPLRDKKAELRKENRKYREAMKEAIEIAYPYVLMYPEASDIESILSEALEESE